MKCYHFIPRGFMSAWGISEEGSVIVWTDDGSYDLALFPDRSARYLQLRKLLTLSMLFDLLGDRRLATSVYLDVYWGIIEPLGLRAWTVSGVELLDQVEQVLFLWNGTVADCQLVETLRQP